MNKKLLPLDILWQTTTILFLTPCLLVADGTSINKWCSKDGARVTYTNQETTLTEYEPCGKVEASKTCSPTGARFISAASNPPHAYRDCNVGDRITVIKDGVVVPYKPYNHTVSYNQQQDAQKPDSFAIQPKKALLESKLGKSVDTKVDDIAAKYDSYLKTLDGLLDEE